MRHYRVTFRHTPDPSDVKVLTSRHADRFADGTSRDLVSITEGYTTTDDIGRILAVAHGGSVEVLAFEELR